MLEVHTLRNGLSPLSETFQLAYNGESTISLAHNADPVSIKNALEALTSIYICSFHTVQL